MATIRNCFLLPVVTRLRDCQFGPARRSVSGMKLVLQAVVVIVLAAIASITLVAVLAILSVAGLKAWLVAAVTVIVVVWLLKRRPSRLQLPWRPS